MLFLIALSPLIVACVLDKKLLYNLYMSNTRKNAVRTIENWWNDILCDREEASNVIKRWWFNILEKRDSIRFVKELKLIRRLHASRKIVKFIENKYYGVYKKRVSFLIQFQEMYEITTPPLWLTSKNTLGDLMALITSSISRMNYCQYSKNNTFTELNLDSVNVTSNFIDMCALEQECLRRNMVCPLKPYTLSDVFVRDIKLKHILLKDVYKHRHKMLTVGTSWNYNIDNINRYNVIFIERKFDKISGKYESAKFDVPSIPGVYNINNSREYSKRVAKCGIN